MIDETTIFGKTFNISDENARIIFLIIILILAIVSTYYMKQTGMLKVYHDLWFT